MPQFQGSCHCGAVRFAFTLPTIERALRCDCSICARKGIVMSTDLVVSDDIEIWDDESVIDTYQFGTMTAHHHFCSRCGIHVFVQTRLSPGLYRINLGCVDGVDVLQLPYDLFDGQSI